MAMASLGEETWGERLARARSRSKVRTLTKAASLVSQVWPVSYSTLMRLELLDAPPQDPKRRHFAVLAVLVYGYNPDDFGLSAADLPPGISRTKLAKLLKEHPAKVEGPTVGSRELAAQAA